MSEIYKLVGSDNPIFGGGFVFSSSAKSLLGRTDFEGKDSAEEDFYRSYGAKTREFKVPSFGKRWTPQPVEGDVNPFHDYPEMVPGIPVFSLRACTALDEFLRPNGELLPLKTKVGKYFVYNLQTIVDVLDAKKSKIEFFPDSFKALSIDWYSFREAHLKQLSIFAVPENSQVVLVTAEFKERVELSGLNGFHFVKVYPFPKGVDWAMEEAKRIRKSPIKAGTKSGKNQNVDAHTVVVFLTLEGAKAKPTAKEKKLVGRLADEAMAQLRLPSIESPYFGRVEGTDVHSGYVRMFMTCPDANVLITKLEPWLRSINWPRKTHIVKRLGQMYDADAEELEVSFSAKGRNEKRPAMAIRCAAPSS